MTTCEMNMLNHLRQHGKPLIQTQG